MKEKCPLRENEFCEGFYDQKLGRYNLELCPEEYNLCFHYTTTTSVIKELPSLLLQLCERFCNCFKEDKKTTKDISELTKTF